MYITKGYFLNIYVFNYANPYEFELHGEGGDFADNIDIEYVEVLNVETEDWRRESVVCCTCTVWGCLPPETFMKGYATT